MLRVLAVLVAWLVSVPVHAFVPGQPAGMLNPQALPNNASAGLPAVDDNFAAAGYPIAGGICAEFGHQVPCNNHYSITRASTKYAMASDGLFASVPNNVMALGSGTGNLIEESRTNLALWARDLTQSGTWVAVTMTATKNAVGIDGTANSATTLTSSSAAGTILQSLTQASAAYTYTVYVKGVTVTGAIQVADYPVLTPAFTTLSASNCFDPTGVGVGPASGQTTFLKCSVTATSLNPVIGFKFANSGDSIVVDFNQLEAGNFGTSPILTTSASAARSADNTTAAGVALTALRQSAGSVVAATNKIVQSAAANPRIVGSTGGTGFGWLDFEPAAAASIYNTISVLNTTNTATLSSANKLGSSWLIAGGRSIVLNNGTVATDANVFAANTNTPMLGSAGGTFAFMDGVIARLTMNSRLPDTTLKAMTQ